jgi:hypothetical protein
MPGTSVLYGGKGANPESNPVTAKCQGKRRVIGEEFWLKSLKQRLLSVPKAKLRRFRVPES